MVHVYKYKLNKEEDMDMRCTKKMLTHKHKRYNIKYSPGGKPWGGGGIGGIPIGGGMPPILGGGGNAGGGWLFCILYRST